MLEARSIVRRYGATVAVGGVSFAVSPGEVVGLLGHNGAGKTTIMKMLSGALEPDEGTVLLDGASVTADPAALQARLGYLPEHLPVYPELSVASCLDYAAGTKGLAGEDRRRAIRRAVEATELGPRLLSPVGTLSRGLRQRVGVAQALLGEPSILILDEPTNGLDPEQTERMRALIREVGARATVMLSTHVMQEVEAVCDRALIVRAGRLAVDTRLDALGDGGRLRVITASPEAAVRRALDGVSVASIDAAPVSSRGGAHEWRLRLVDGREPAEAVADVVAALVAGGVRVSAADIDRRTLQGLFMDASEGAAHVA